MSTQDSDPSQPTIYEMIRMQSADMRHLGDTLARIEGTMNGLVTQEQRAADKAMADQRHQYLVDRVAEDEERTTWVKRAAVTSLGAPLVVGVMLWATGASVQLPT